MLSLFVNGIAEDFGKVEFLWNLEITEDLSTSNLYSSNLNLFLLRPSGAWKKRKIRVFKHEEIFLL